MKYFIYCWKRYADFSGRARRSEFWYFSLINVIIYIILMGLAQLSIAFNIIYVIYLLAVFIPHLAVFWRRLHDIGRAGGWYFIWLIPVVGLILLLIWNFTDSEKGTNRFGENPKGIN